MSHRTGRRQFLKTIAAAAAAASSGCYGNDESTGEYPRAGSGPSTAPASGSTGQAASAGLPNVATGGAAQSPTGAGGASGGTVEASGGAPTTGGTLDASGGAPASGGDPSAGGDGGATEPDDRGGSSGAEAVEENPRRPTSPLGIALLGLGSYAGGRLAPALQLTEHCRLKGIVTGTPSKVPTWQERYGIESKNVYSYDNMAALLDNPDIHVVYVVTPNHVHAQYAIAAARAKKHVWCEKPMAMNPQECQSIIDACRENGVQLSIGYRLQHEPNTQTVIRYASTKPFGAIQEVNAKAGFRGFSPSEAGAWRLKRAMGGGALYDMGVYAINAARYATGEEPIRVRNARQWVERADLFSEVDEWTEFELEFPSGVIAYCRTSFGEGLNSLDVLCASGSYRLEPMHSYEGVRGEASDGTQLDETLQNQQAKQMDDDALAILEGREVLVPGEEGLRDVRIVQAIQQAASSGLAVDL